MMTFQNTDSFSLDNSITKRVRSNVVYTSTFDACLNEEIVWKLSKTVSFSLLFSSTKTLVFGKSSVNESLKNKNLEKPILFTQAKSVFAQARILFGSILKVVSGTRKYFSPMLKLSRAGEMCFHPGEKCSRTGEMTNSLNFFGILMRRKDFSPARKVFSPTGKVSTLRRNTSGVP